jgi:hypothetical protein
MDLASVYGARLRRQSGIWKGWTVWARARVVEFFQDNKCYLVEPQLRILGESMPRLSTLRYVPQFSASWDGKTLAYYAHKERLHQLSFIRLPGLIAEWVKIWGWFWVKVFFKSPIIVRNLFRKVARRFSKTNKT